MIGFYTKFTTVEGTRDKFITLLTRAADSMQDNTDCSIYIVNTDDTDANVVWVTEVWTSKEAHQASLEREEAKELIVRAMPLVAAPPEQTVVEPVAGKGLS